MTLFWQQFRAQLTGLLIWLGATLGLVLMTSRAAPSFMNQGDLTGLVKSMPHGLQNMIGVPEGLSAVDGYMATSFTKTFILMMVLYAVLLALSVVTREVDRRTVDFLLSLPVNRAQVLGSRVAVVAVNTALQGAVIWAGFRYDLEAQGFHGSWGAAALTLLNVWLLAMALAGITLLGSLWVDDYSLGVKLFMGLAAASWVLEFSLRAVDVGRWARAFSPFSYVDPVAVLRAGAIPWSDALVLTGVAAVTIGLSFPVFQRKQITA
jgi:ABC-2 type transport system permease protein